MSLEILRIIAADRKAFVPLIISPRQHDAIKKYVSGRETTKAERKYLYTVVKRKVQALRLLISEVQGEREYFINSGWEIKPERLERAKQVIRQLSARHGKVFIAGTFLFSEQYNDIDIYIIGERYNEAHEGKFHYIFVPEKKLAHEAFQSAARISVANFKIPFKLKKKRKFLYEIMSTYHEAVIELDKREKKPEALRSLVFDYCLECEKRPLNSKELKEEADNIMKKKQLAKLDRMCKELLKKTYSKKYLYVGLHRYIKSLDSAISSIKANENLKRYKKTYEELIYESRRAKAEAY